MYAITVVGIVQAVLFYDILGVISVLIHCNLNQISTSSIKRNTTVRYRIVSYYAKIGLKRVLFLKNPVLWQKQPEHFSASTPQKLKCWPRYLHFLRL